MARESRTKYAVLGMLHLGPKCGYEIKKELERSSMFFWNESYGQIYPMLKKLVQSGLATLEVVERDDQPDMKVYTITAKGSAELERWLSQPAEPHPVRDEMLLKFYFGSVASADLNLAHIERLKAHLQRQREDFDVQRDLYVESAQESSEQEALYWMLTLRYGELVNEAVQRWCEEASEAVDLERSKAQRS